MEITNVNQLDPNKVYTYGDYLLWKFEERVELFGGKISKIEPTSTRIHQGVLRDINRQFDKVFVRYILHPSMSGYLIQKVRSSR